MLLYPKGKQPDPPPIPAVRNKTSIRAVFDKAMTRGQKITLERAIEILKAGW